MCLFVRQRERKWNKKVNNISCRWLKNSNNYVFFKTHYNGLSIVTLASSGCLIYRWSLSLMSWSKFLLCFFFNKPITIVMIYSTHPFSFSYITILFSFVIDEIKRFMEEVKTLGYQDKPPYERLRSILQAGLKSIQAKDDGKLDFTTVNGTTSPHAQVNSHANSEFCSLLLRLFV